MRSRLILVLMIGVASAATASGQPPACPRCTTTLDVTVDQWSCLQKRLPQLKEQQTPVVFFSLSSASCIASTDSSPRGTSVTIPTRSAPSAGAPAPPQILRLTQDQLGCLVERAAGLAPVEGRISIDLETFCRAQ